MNGFTRLIRQCRKANVQVIFSHANAQPMREFQRSGLYDWVGAEFFQPNIDAALEKAETL